MQIAFVRSGGFAGMATRVEGAVQFDEHGARVSSGAAGYARDLAPEEAQKLRAAADPQGFANAGSQPAGPGALRDAFQYDITVTTKDGKTHKLTQHGDPTVPGPNALLEWVKQEADRIWTHRLEKR